VNGSFHITMQPATEAPKANARFYGLNFLSELDVPGEFYLELSDTVQKLYLIPPASMEGSPTTWESGPVIALKEAVVNISGTTGVSVKIS
jgi:hypothetical protein